MKLSPINISALGDVPGEISRYLARGTLYDSSCSKTARTVFIDGGRGEEYFLKIAPSGALAREAEVTAVFHEAGFAAEVVAYIGDFGACGDFNGRDFLLTRKIRGDDCCSERFLREPERHIPVFARALRRLNDADSRLFTRLKTGRLRHDASENGENDEKVENDTKIPSMAEAALRIYDSGAPVDYWLLEYIAPDEADCPAPPFSDELIRRFAEELRANAGMLRDDEVIHGDACLPNVLLDGSEFSGFVDVGDGGLGDRHHDLFWALWSLQFNLKTRKYAGLFLDAYGRDAYDPARFRLAAVANALSWRELEPDEE